MKHARHTKYVHPSIATELPALEWDSGVEVTEIPLETTWEDLCVGVYVENILRQPSAWQQTMPAELAAI